MSTIKEWMTREEIANYLGIVPNSVRGKVQKGQIERKIEGGKNYYRVITATPHVPKSGAKRKLSRRAEQIPEQKGPGKTYQEAKVTPEPVVSHEPRPVSAEPQQPVVVQPAPAFRLQELPSPLEKPPFPDKPLERLTRQTLDKSKPFNPKQVLKDMLASLRVGRSIEAIEKGDEIDLATGEIARELDARISMRQYKQIKEIEDALERIEHGEYGICEDCGEPIPEQRLRLFPAARLCVRCQEEADQLEKLKEDQSMRGVVWRDDTVEGGVARSFEE